MTIAKIVLWLCFAVYVMTVIAIHSTACNAHVEAVKLYRVYHPHSEKFAWSYAYCNRVGSLSRGLF